MKPSEAALELAQRIVNLAYQDRGGQIPHRDDIALLIDEAVKGLREAAGDEISHGGSSTYKPHVCSLCEAVNRWQPKEADDGK